MQRANNILLIATVLIGSASFTACKSDDENGGNAGAGAGGMTGGVGGATGGSGGGAGTMSGGAGGMTGGMGGAAGTVTTGGMGGMTGGTGGTTGGMGGMTGGSGGMGGMTGGTGGMTGGMGGMTGGMGGGEPDAGGGDSATFTEVYSIIQEKCGGGTFGCHVMGSSGMLNMQSKMNAFMNLVNVDSEECDGEKRVIPGDADNSLLIQALEGTACIDQMPDGRDPLSEEEIGTIRAWIDDGAMNN